MPKRKYILRGIEITLIDSATFTVPYSYSKTCPTFRTACGDLTTARTLRNNVSQVVKFSFTSSNHTPAFSLLYRSIVFSAENPVFKTDFAILVFTSLFALKSPTKINLFFLTSMVLALCK